MSLWRGRPVRPNECGEEVIGKKRSNGFFRAESVLAALFRSAALRSRLWNGRNAQQRASKLVNFVFTLRRTPSEHEARERRRCDRLLSFARLLSA